MGHPSEAWAPAIPARGSKASHNRDDEEDHGEQQEEEEGIGEPAGGAEECRQTGEEGRAARRLGSPGRSGGVIRRAGTSVARS
jgi:hypothetical protein